MAGSELPVRIVDADGKQITSFGGGGTASNPSYVATVRTAGTNRGGTITAGGTAQTFAVANPNRTRLTGQNLSTGDLWINEVGGTASASQPSYRIPAGQSFEVTTNQAVSIWGATTGQAFAGTES